MKLVRLLGGWLLAGGALAGCSSATTGPAATSGAGSKFAAQVCAKLSSCSITVTNCEGAFAALVLSSSCQGSMLNATCADLNASPIPASLASCFPSCTGTTGTCNPDQTITVCTGTNQYEYSCSGLCAASSTAYTGTCATTFNGQTSSNGQPKCWCK